jgi:arylsulfatase A-like enzyme
MFRILIHFMVLIEITGGKRPNIVFLVVESTDGRSWTPGYQNDVVPIPNIRNLQDRGTQFTRHYSNAPVCCPSRASFWSGRHVSNIPHEHNGVDVGGAWNNFEGLPDNFTNRIDQVMSRAGYSVKMSGKTDWSTGGHSENVYLNAWTMNVPFPYDVNRTGGWFDETICMENATIEESTVFERHEDWKTVRETTQWIKDYNKNDHNENPFFVYQGMNIVHPPYVTNRYWSEKINRTRIEIPEWIPLMELHPCDFQSSMLKGCTPSDNDSTWFYNQDRIREIRAVYYAMIAEFDAMVGAYIDAVRDSGVSNNTIFIVTSDHGDMQMERQQFYKMVPYEASASVPMVVYDGRNPQETTRVVSTVPTQLIDIFPSILELANVSKHLWPQHLDGHSFVSLLSSRPSGSADSTKTTRPDYVISQFHGDNIAMSWFLIVQRFQDTFYKLIVWGTGQEVPSMFFDLNKDPKEMRNLIAESNYTSIINEMKKNLNSVVDVDKVAMSVLNYSHAMMINWINQTSNWREQIHKTGLRWDTSWNASSYASFKALDQWIQNPTLQSCRHSLNWP